MCEAPVLLLLLLLTAAVREKGAEFWPTRLMFKDCPTHVLRGDALRMQELKQREERELVGEEAFRSRGEEFLSAVSRVRFKPEFYQERVGCAGVPGALAWATRRLFRPDSEADVNTQFFLRTRRRREAVEVRDLAESAGEQGPVLDGNLPLFVLIHGFLSSAEAPWVADMANALLDQVDANVVAVDWSGGADTWRYWKAVANARVACGASTRMLQALRGLDPRRVHCIGHSLGAHVCSFVAKQFGGLGRVTGLDPAQPCFQPDDSNMRLTRQDARFVDVIHTNGRPLLRLGLGLPEPLGHADFYPNGGGLQPGCGDVGNVFIPSSVQRTLCSHGRAHMLYIEAVRGANCSFWGRAWDRRPQSVPAVLVAPCDMQRCSQMGLRADQFPAVGSFYVQTNEAAPYCRRQPDVDAQMGRLLAASNVALSP